MVDCWTVVDAGSMKCRLGMRLGLLSVRPVALLLIELSAKARLVATFLPAASGSCAFVSTLPSTSALAT